MTTAKALLGTLRVRVRAPRLTKPGQPRARDKGHGECTGLASPHGLPDPASRPGGDLEPVGAGSSQQGTALWNVNCAVGLFALSSRAHCITFTGLPTGRAVVGCSPSFAAAHRVLHPSVCSCPSADLPACCVSSDFPHLTACRLCVCRGVHPWKCRDNKHGSARRVTELGKPYHGPDLIQRSLLTRPATLAYWPARGPSLGFVWRQAQGQVVSAHRPCFPPFHQCVLTYLLTYLWAGVHHLPPSKSHDLCLPFGVVKGGVWDPRVQVSVPFGLELSRVGHFSSAMCVLPSS